MDNMEKSLDKINIEDTAVIPTTEIRSSSLKRDSECRKHHKCAKRCREGKDESKAERLRKKSEKLATKEERKKWKDDHKKEKLAKKELKLKKKSEKKEEKAARKLKKEEKRKLKKMYDSDSDQSESESDSSEEEIVKNDKIESNRNPESMEVEIAKESLVSTTARGAGVNDGDSTPKDKPRKELRKRSKKVKMGDLMDDSENDGDIKDKKKKKRERKHKQHQEKGSKGDSSDSSDSEREHEDKHKDKRDSKLEKIDKLLMKLEKKREKLAQAGPERADKKVKEHGKGKYKNYPAENRIDLYTVDWTGFNHFYVDGNNLMYLTSSIRKLSLRRGGRDDAAKLLSQVAKEFSSAIHVDTTIVFDGGRLPTVDENLNGITFRITRARPDFESSDDQLVWWARTNLDVAGKTIVVTSDRELGDRLRELGVEIAGPKSWVTYAAKLSKTKEGQSLDEWLDEKIAKMNLTY